MLYKNKNDKQKPKVEDRLKWSACYNLINKNETENNMSNRRKVKCMGCEYGNYFGNENISKHFSGVKALDKIQFDLRKEKSIHFSEKMEPESQP